MNYTCPKCKHEFEKGTKFCQTCGCNLELEYIENPVCPNCKTTYPANTKFCANDGAVLVRSEDLIPRCVVCDIAYAEDVKFCPTDGGEIKTGAQRRFSQSVYGQTQFFSKPSYPKAPLGARFLAYLIDWLIASLLAVPAIIFMMMGISKVTKRFHDYVDSSEYVPLFILAFLLYFIPIVYAFIKDGLGEGQSWGKHAMGIMVVNLDDNTPCNKSRSFFRNFISIIVGIIPLVGWIIEAIMVIATTDGRKLGDRGANTQVISREHF